MKNLERKSTFSRMNTINFNAALREQTWLKKEFNFFYIFSNIYKYNIIGDYLIIYNLF